MRQPRRGLLLVVAGGTLLGSAACASVAVSTRPPATMAASATAPPLAGDQSLVADRLIFGRDIPTGGRVSDSEWSDFMRDVITPISPNGLSVFRGDGQWLDAKGALWKETSMVVEILHPLDQPADSVFERVANEYRRRFHQDAVLRETWPVRTRLYDSPLPPR